MILAAELWGADYFTKFAIFNDGLGGAIFLFVFFWAFTYVSMRGVRDKPGEVAVEVLAPLFVVALALFAFGIHPFISGVLVLVVYLVTIKLMFKPSMTEWLGSVLYVFALLGLFGFVDITTRWILFGAYLVVGFIQSEKRIRDKDTEKKNKSDK